MTADETLQQLLRLLADGDYHSGQALGKTLGISRTAVWKQLQKVQQWLPLESHRGRGYCIPGGLDLLDQNTILARLQPRSKTHLSALTVLMETDSTNAWLLRGGHTAGAVCLAERQLTGRGRRGRPWVSPFAQNLYLSVLWRFGGGAGVLEGLSLAVGVTIAQALEELGLTGAGLKWPNDVLWQGDKLAGILLEMTGDPAGECQVVVGVGLNVNMPEAEQIDQPWTDLTRMARAQGIAPPSRSQLTAVLLDHLLPLLAEFDQRGFADWRDAWLERAVGLGQQVDLQTVTRQISGRLLGVDTTGALRLEVEQGEQVFHGGEVSLRMRP